MANEKHLSKLKEGTRFWNDWIHRRRMKLGGTTELADLRDIDLSDKCFRSIDLGHVNLDNAKLDYTDLGSATLTSASLKNASLKGASLNGADMNFARLDGARLENAYLIGTNLLNAHLSGACLAQATMTGAHFHATDLTDADLKGANLERATIVECKAFGANFTGCKIYGISIWDIEIDSRTRQNELVISKNGEPAITLDNIEVAQFVYLLLHSSKIRGAIDTIGKKGVLLLGRFTEGRLAILERLRDELRKRDYLPIVFNFDKPETKDFTETVKLLAGLSKFVIADVTNPKSTPLELQATVPELMIPFQPIIEKGQTPFAMLQDLWIKHREWVLTPLYYSSVDALVAAFDKEIIRPAEERFDALIMRKAETMKGRHI